MPTNIWAVSTTGSVQHYWIGQNETLCGYMMLLQSKLPCRSARGTRMCWSCWNKFNALRIDAEDGRNEN